MMISPGQALLLLISDCKKKQPQNSEHLNNLILFYLDGVANPDQRNELVSIFNHYQHNVLKGFNISFDVAAINEDASRRYF